MGNPVSVALHIGAHKTATSHFQKSLYANREMLAEAGIRTYGPAYLRHRGRSIQAMFGLPMSDGRPPRRTPQEQIAFLAKGGNRIVLSEENFCGSLRDDDGHIVFPLCNRAVERISLLAEKIAPSPLDLFLCVRDPAGYLTSAYGQTILGAADALTPDAFRASVPMPNVDWAELVTRLRGIPRVGKIYVWRHEDYAQVFRLVCRRLLRWQVGKRVEPLPTRVHEGLSERAVTKYFHDIASGQGDDTLGVRARAAFPVSRGHEKFNLFDADDTLASAQAYAAQITLIEDMKGVTFLHPPKHNVSKA